jgi:hypothetical protein
MAKKDPYEAVKKRLPPMSDVARPSEKALATLAKTAPAGLIELWEKLGWGRFGDGFLLLTDPKKLAPTVDQWLGGKNPSRIPLGRTGLGDLLYFRDLRERAKMLGMTGKEAEEACDISVVNVRYKRAGVLATSVAEFVKLLASEEFLDEELGKNLFDEALPRLGAPSAKEIYGFVPALAMGGSEDADSLDKVNAEVHLEILFQL